MATLRVMAERGRLDPDVGYWAQRWDPEGRLHPLYYTSRYDHRWVNATTLPVLYAAYPLWRLGGYRLTLLLPMLGSVAAAVAARALARRLSGGTSDGWAAFWIVGLASPLTIYALDLWEHSIGVALMAWAVVLLLDAAEERRRLSAFAGAGALFGAAAALRTEALVYAFVGVGAACLVLLVVRRKPVPAVAGGLVAVGAFAVPVVLNTVLEQVTVGQAIRFGRAAGTASAAVSDATGSGDGALATRLKEAFLTAGGLHPILEPMSCAVAVALVVLLAYACWRSTRPGGTGPAVVAGIGVVAMYGVRFADGLGFVPGLAAATPLAVAGVVLGWRRFPGRFVLGVALAALPLVWATQFSGGAGPQWAGRYILLSGLLAGVVGIVALPALPLWVARGLVGLAATITVFGLAWTSQRTHQFAEALAALDRRPEPVVVSRVGHLGREGGWFYGDHRWLTAVYNEDATFAVDVLERAGVRSFALVDLSESHRRDLAYPGWHVTGHSRVTLVRGVPLTVVTYETV